MSPVYLNELGVCCALGRDIHEVTANLFAADAPRGVTATDTVLPGRTLALGAVPGDMPSQAHLPAPLRGRNNALIDLALAPIRARVDDAVARYGPEQVAVVLGTSTSGVGESEHAHRLRVQDGDWPDSFHYAQQEMGMPAHYLAGVLGVKGPAHIISTACSSSAKALASGARLLRSGVVDAVVAGGADSLCRFTVAGFDSLGSVSRARCNPFSRNRNGINIGEGAALFLMTREPGPVRLAGWGESSDAHHMSAPEPSGAGPELAIREALRRAGVAATDIAYVNLHGTATSHNDAMEAGVMARVFGPETPASSTKPLTGHALGAAGGIEAAICWLALTHPRHALPPHWWDGESDAALAPVHLVAPGATAAGAPGYVLSQSFAFGGSNAALVLGRS